MWNRIIPRLMFLLIKIAGKGHSGLNLLKQLGEHCAKLQGIGIGGSVDSSGEDVVLRNLYRSLADDLTIFDVGANRGKYAELLLSVFGNKKFTVHCFEPAHDTFLLLESNKYIAGNSHVILNNFALGKIGGGGRIILGSIRQRACFAYTKAAGSFWHSF